MSRLSSQVGEDNVVPPSLKQDDADGMGTRSTTPTASPTSHLEVEWQFDSDELLGVEIALLGRPLELEPRVVPGGLIAIEDRYLDTADLRLLRAGYACRLRTTATGQELTLKSATTVARGPQRRVEHSQALPAGMNPATVNMAGGEVSDLIRLVAGQRALLQLFEVRTSRRTFLLTVEDTRAGEISLDRTTIMPLDDGEAVPVRLRRVELEAVGRAEASEVVRKFATGLRKAHRLRWGKQSKFELGLQAGDWLRRGTIDLGPTQIHAGISIGALARVAIRRHLADLLYHEPATRLGEDIEALHQMRVANRRLRADIRLFSGALPAPWQAIDTELRWLGGVLGAVRDLDVQLARIADWIAADTRHELEGLGGIRQTLEERRAQARVLLLEALDGSRYSRLIERMTQMLREDEMSLPTSNRSAVVQGAALLTGLERKVRRLATGLQPESDPERFHELRIVCKRFRYALEAFAPLYGKAAERLIRRVVALQDLLGAHQDATIAADELRALVVDESLPSTTIFTLGRLAERSLAEAQRLRARFPGVYQHLGRSDWIKLRGKMERLAAKTSGPGKSARR